LHLGVTFAAAFVAGAMNSVAGGGTLITFPTLIWLGLPSVTANATSTVAIWPGSLGAMWGYRRELRGSDSRMLALVAPSLIGGLIGALLLRLTPTETFDRLVPFLILFATLLFTAQQPVQNLLKRLGSAEHHSGRWLAGAMLFQLLVALYGGYFGAGIGILMLAALSVLGLTDIHQMNGWKNFFALCINGVAALYFMLAKMVFWPDVLVMAIGAIAGGYGGAGVARRLGRSAVRRIVIIIGFGMALSLFFKR
ncbi:MAG TPA: sulfite exporter TauE/SafE family protein, partial [Bryobacteraceae bacterium]|nr:sulfite exporter TauE/SafE family protein [Bryobacteraceae bacterium]